MDHNNYGLVTTRSQNELALGYVMDKFRYPPAYPNGMHSPGVLKSHSSYQEAVQKGDSATLHSCKSSSEENKFTWAAYNGVWEVSQVFYPNASASELKVSGHQSLFVPAKHVKSCDKSLFASPAKKYEIFMARLKRRGTVVYDKQVSAKSLTLKRFRLDENLVTVNNRTVFTSGLLDMSNFFGFPILIGFPRFLHGEEVLGKKLGLPEANQEKHGSFIDIEPFTGMALRAVFRFQVSAVVSSGLVSSQVHPRPLNVSYVDDNAPYYKNVIPLFRTVTANVLSTQQAETFKNQVLVPLRRSCGLMVVMFATAGLCLFVGLILLALSVSVNRNTVSVDLTEN